MECHHYDAGRCRSCTLLPVPLPEQVAGKARECRELLDAAAVDVGGLDWLPPYSGAGEGFRNKAKMAVGGTVDSPTLGILDHDLAGVDLRDCGLHSPGLTAALEVLAAFVTRAALTPYDVRSRRGELKYLLVTEAPSGALMIRFVARSREPETRLRKHLPWLLAQLPDAHVVSLNLQPEPKAVLEGETEIVLTEATTLPMGIGVGAGVPLHLRPQSFFQTNTEVATALYREAAAWVADLDVRRLWDLYCGVGGFALTLAGEDRTALGVEVSPEAVASARTSAEALGLSGAEFVTADATAWVLAHDPADAPDLVVVNPPRRGIGADLAGWLERSRARYVLYSSCNAATLATDLAAMPSLRPVRARLLDMFPQTRHYEVLVLAGRT